MLFRSDEYTYDAEGEEGPRAKRKDYDTTEIIPVSDPNASTMSQRVVQYQAAFQLSQAAPQVYNIPRLHRQMLEVLGIKHADKIVELPEDMKPEDPVTENMNVLRSKPVKAFAYQDHEAHMATHQSFMQDPKVAMAIGQNPAAQQMMSALQTHIAEHAAFAYRAQIEMALGIPLPSLNEDDEAPISMQDEKNLAPLIAAAAQRTMVQNQAMAAQQQAQQQMQNPELQLAQAELQLKQAEMQRKSQKDQIDAQLASQRLVLEQQRLAAESQKSMTKMAVEKQTKDADRSAKAQIEFVKHMSRNSQPKNRQ